MMRKFINILLLYAACFATGCRQHQPVAGVQPENTFTINGSVREIKITPENMQFPELKGRQQFMSFCAVCHSLKYISMQPDFPRKVWEAEVTKMVAKYKAPIDSATCKIIVEYLVAVKGKK